jgi:ketosteroid isomerase-like protein
MSTTTKPDLSITTTDHPNAQRLRDGFAAFGRGDLDAVRATLTDNCTWTSGGSTAISGSYTGWDAIQQMFGTLVNTTDGTFSMNVLSTVADDQHAIAIYDATSTIKGVTETQRFVIIDDMTPEGKASAVHSLAYDQDAADAHFNR